MVVFNDPVPVENPALQAARHSCVRACVLDAFPNAQCLQEDAGFQHLWRGAGRRQDLNLRPPRPERGRRPGSP
jgi:hypothetical protein